VIVSVPTGAAEEPHDAFPFETFAVQSCVAPAEKATDPLEGNPVIVGVTVAE